MARPKKEVLTEDMMEKSVGPSPTEKIQADNDKAEILEFEGKLAKKYAELNDINTLIEKKNELKAQCMELDRAKSKKEREVNAIISEINMAELNIKQFEKRFNEANAQRIKNLADKESKLEKAILDYDKAMSEAQGLLKDAQEKSKSLKIQQDAFNAEKASFVEFCDDQNKKINFAMDELNKKQKAIDSETKKQKDTLSVIESKSLALTKQTQEAVEKLAKASEEYALIDASKDALKKKEKALDELRQRDEATILKLKNYYEGLIKENEAKTEKKK